MSKTPAELLVEEKTAQRVGKLHKRKYVRTWVCKVAEVRTALGISQRDVSKSLGFSPSYMAFVEAGIDLGLSKALKIANFFGKSINELWPSLLEESEK